MASFNDPYQSPHVVRKQPLRPQANWHRLLCILLFFGPSILLAFLIATQTNVQPIVLIRPIGMREITLVDAAVVIPPLFFLTLSCSVALLGERKYRLLWVLLLTVGMVLQCVVSACIGGLVQLFFYGFSEEMF